jgi:hypothetical protein
VSKNEWADEFIIMFMPDIIKLPVCILTFENDTLQLWQKFEGMNNIQRGKEPVYLLYDPVDFHYDMLLPREEGDSLAGDVPSGVNRAANAQAGLSQMLVGKTPVECRQILGDRLYPLIHMKQPSLTGKITGMLLEGLDNSELVTLINDNVALESKIEEALAALDAHNKAQAGLSSQVRSPQKGGVPHQAQQRAHVDSKNNPDYENLKYLTSIYTRILKTASLQLELSAKFRPPKLGGYIAEPDLADVFREWNAEYEYGKRVLQNCRNEFLNCEWTLTSQHFKLSAYFWGHTLDGHTEQWLGNRMYANPEEWFRPKDKANPIGAVGFWTRQIKNAESIFLQRNIDGFVKIISSRITQAGGEGGEHEFGALGLIGFQFEKHKVEEWVHFYTNRTKGKFPRLPEQCVRTSSSDADFRTYQEMWGEIQHYSRPEKNPEEQRRLRKWYHTRACLAFHKAVRRAQLTPEKQEQYSTRNRVRADEAHYFVVGSAMSTPIHPVEGKTNKYLVLGV